MLRGETRGRRHRDRELSQPGRGPPKRRPAPYVTAPAAIPVSMLSMPLRHHERAVMIVLAAPTANSTSTVMITEIAIPLGGAKNRYGATGTVAPMRYDIPTTNDDLS